MKWQWMAVIAVLAGACQGTIEGTDTIVVQLGGNALDAVTTAGISGMQVTVAQLDSLNKRGVQPTFRSDSTDAAGHFSVELDLAKPGNICAAGAGFVFDLKLTDPRGVYQTTSVTQQLCLHTAGELLAAQSLRVLVSKR